jgi:TetR/AcrR family transcriptional regulator, copper-responsive repressor
MVQKEPGAAARPRGRPRSFDADEVLDKARAVFWNLGYAAASLDDIAAATGLNRPSLYAAFGDKHALYMAALARTRAGAAAAMRAMMAAEGPLRAVLSALFDAAIGSYVAGDVAQRGCFIIGTAVTQAVDDPDARALLTGFVADEDAAFRERFVKSADELAAGMTPAAAAVVATAALHTLAIRARTGEGREALAEVADAAVNAICGPG